MSSSTLRRNAIDVWEFARFIATGITATIGNIGAVWFVSRYASFEFSLLAGIAAGLLLSFTLSKLVAFRSQSWRRAPGEALRFLVVYGTGALIYWIVGFVAGRQVLPRYVDGQVAESGEALIGAGIMTFTSYFGHRFFTYGTFHRMDLMSRASPRSQSHDHMSLVLSRQQDQGQAQSRVEQASSGNQAE